MIGRTLGTYEVLTKLGEGGMGEVYRARDTRLNREIALKVLPELFLLDPDRLARFEREAQLLASLNHPNIAHIYEAGKSGANVLYLALELVPGPTLAERLQRGPLSLDEALAIARQIVDALEAAHEQGVIHRDLKPANIKVRDDGTVKVLDFGLAKALSPQGASGSEAQNSPTMSARATEMGLILGTAAYMSPEQAKGKPADQRADVWAFGAVLFEMLAGKQVFTGETASEVMASVLKEEPDWSKLPPQLSPGLRRLLRRCLEKDPRKRMSAMSDVRLELNEKDIAMPDSSSATGRRSWLSLAGAAAAGAAITAAAFLFTSGSSRPATARESARVSVMGPEGVSFAFDAAESAISPDGRLLVFTANDPTGATRLWLRPLDGQEAHLLAGTELGHLPFWSPDSAQIAFFAGDKLKKMPAAGGTVEVICDAPNGRGGTWGSQNIIVFAPSSSGPLAQVSAAGGSEAKPATALDSAKGETGHRFPNFLPDGRHFMFAALPQKNLQYDLYVGSTDSTAREPFLTAEGAAVYAEPGYVLFPRRGVLFAQPFNAGTLKVSGEPVAVTDAPSSTGGLYASGRAISVTTTGALAYLGDRLPNTKLVWLDRTGRQTGTLDVPEGRYQEIDIAPDGKRAAIVQYTTQSDTTIWIADVVRGGATRFTSQRSENFYPTWSPDSSRIVFASNVHGTRDLFEKPASGATPETTFYESPALFKDARAWSPDGQTILFEQLDPKTNRDIWAVSTSDHKASVYIQTPYADTAPVFSPDGKWVAFASDESGHNEIYIDSFPTPRGKYKVTDIGSSGAYWRHDGKELLVANGDGTAFFAVDVTIGATVTTGKPRKLFDVPKTLVNLGPTPDFQRFLAALATKENAVSSLTIIFDWTGTLKKK